MDLYWLEQTVNDVPFGEDWLSPKERTTLSTLHVPKRRSDWRLGRWTAKTAVAAYLGLAPDANLLAAVEVRSAPSGAPEVFLVDRPAPLALSLSHCMGTGLCVIAPAGTEVGCDLEKVESRSHAFLTDYFTESEQAWIALAPVGRQDRLVTLLWSAKESALKVMRCGLREDTLSVNVLRGLPGAWAAGWQRLTVERADGGSFSGWWSGSPNLVRTILVTAREGVASLHEISGTAQNHLLVNTNQEGVHERC